MYVSELRRRYPDAPQDAIERAAFTRYEMFTDAILLGGITRETVIEVAARMRSDFGPRRGASPDPRNVTRFPQPPGVGLYESDSLYRWTSRTGKPSRNAEAYRDKNPGEAGPG